MLRLCRRVHFAEAKCVIYWMLNVYYNVYFLEVLGTTDQYLKAWKIGRRADRFEAAKAYFDAGEYLRAHALLSSDPESSVDVSCNLTHKSRFLKNYSLFLAGEKQKRRWIWR
ncbi:unnamed protein product [Peronospora destructor]|uniref:Cdc23 domain-containing protein n=1 Tax=Peronospora destructor TaxID=86335 RepID=A0AAV0UJN4_9STRA|nr:unnamed protein product [Peronospora destructor]